MKQLSFVILTLTVTTALYGQSQKHAVLADDSCKTEIDSITKQVVYIAADTEPSNEGGENKLKREFERNIITDDIGIDAKNYDPNIIVAFIVDKDGSIKGERVVNDKTEKLGKQMLDVIKSFKWTPAKCNGKFVSMILKRKMIIDSAEQ
jgi:TonB-like protein